MYDFCFYMDNAKISLNNAILGTYLSENNGIDDYYIWIMEI